jgi:hypothetical protein
MSAKKPKTPHAKALAAFITGRITRAEYKGVCTGEYFIRGTSLYRMNAWHDSLFQFERRIA